MPEELKKDTPMVDIDTSGDAVDVVLKDEDKKIETEELDTTSPTVTAPTVETSGEELEDYSDKVKKRIDKLTGKLRESERREQAAIDYAKKVANENKTVKTKLNSLDSSYLEQYKARTEAETVQAKKTLQQAIEAGDIDAQVEAQAALSRLAIDQQRHAESTQERELAKKEPVDKTTESFEPKPAKKVDPKAESWAEKNPWFGVDEPMTYASFGLHRRLVSEGFDPNSDEYYTEIDKRIKNEFPHKFKDEGGSVNGSNKPVQTVASASRGSAARSGRKTVRLTPSQVHIAKRLGVPLEEYAKYVKEDA
jgi:hypothetical protein|tara:strand:- start:1941 stop:2864 length:924 start_codon:yes stop_codon:yes gene_type:complete